MNRPTRPTTPLPDPTNNMTEGWHCLHLYYTLDPSVFQALDQSQIAQACDEIIEIVNPEREGAPQRIQNFVVSGHGADFGLMILDPDPLLIDGIAHAISKTALGSFLIPSYSFVSITEVSEYVPTEEQYAERLKREGTDPSDPAFEAKLNAYKARLPMMNKQRTYPDFPAFPVHCFYPMNKIRDPHANWYTIPFSERSRLMAEHANSGIAFAGKVSQLITASTGFDDWEWGVTLWGRAPEHIKDIVYKMRFDEASARYAEFGSFLIGYIMPTREALSHLKLI